MVFASPAQRADPDAAERPFGAVDLLSLVLQALRPSLGFDVSVAVLVEDGRLVAPIFTTGALRPGVIEGIHVQAVSAFVELAGPAYATMPGDEPVVVALPGAGKGEVPEPESYEDAPLVVSGAVTGLLRVSCPSGLSEGQRSQFFTMAADVSRAIERLEAQRSQARLAQERLLQSEKMSSVGQLVSGVAHELNNPLTGIMGFAQLLLLKDLDEGVRQQVETIYAEAERASKIVSNLLSFARRRKAQKDPSNINTLIERVLELRNYDLRVRNIDTELDLDPDLPETMVDPNQMQQVFLNIILNAEQAMRSGGDTGTLRIRTRADGDTIRISFADTGPGMSAETLRRIFDPFFTTKDAGEGTGLGLTISYNIIEEHGGRVWAESDGKRGTTFHIELPVVGAGAGRRETREAPEGALPPALAEKRRILVVDDEESIQKLLTGVLEMDGHEVAIARNGQEALDRVQAEAFDLVITDIKMPVMGGTDLYRRLADAGNPLARRVIFITGDTVAPDTRKFLQGVENAVLSKPFRLRDVREAVGAALRA
ncbi:MAG TPA: ATP-binding protein [Dehalococcoidia bacterium]|nr:ATP-binding protein [Dehalococcoidia bacterium]